MSENGIRKGYIVSMITKQKVWWIYNQETGKRADEVPEATIVKYLARLPLKRWSDWYLWRPGMQQWQNLVNCPEVYSQLPTSVRDNPWERRSQQRFKVRVEVVVVIGKKAFRTYTDNLSFGGLCLEVPIPWKHLEAKECRVFLVSPCGDERVVLESRIIDDENDSRRIAFKSVQESHVDLLMKWFKIAAPGLGEDVRLGV